MSYLSFDVGIKNLSYCVLSPEGCIERWGIINLNKDEQNCQVHLRKECKKEATYLVKDDCEVNYCCTSHKGKFSKLKKIKSNTNNITEVSKKCIHALREMDLSNIVHVLIENQPALKNPIMKSIQMIIYTFFLIESEFNDSTIKNIHMVNARNKLKVYKGPSVNCPYTNEKKNKYKINKFLSIAYTKNMIENEKEEIQKIFHNSKKKDDLADAYLQGIYWINKG